MASKNHIYIYYLPAIRYTYLNADVIFVPKREIGDEFHYVLKVLESNFHLFNEKIYSFMPKQQYFNFFSKTQY